jgi:hypothetical protein
MGLYGGPTSSLLALTGSMDTMVTPCYPLYHVLDGEHVGTWTKRERERMWGLRGRVARRDLGIQTSRHHDINTIISTTTTSSSDVHVHMYYMYHGAYGAMAYTRVWCTCTPCHPILSLRSTSLLSRDELWRIPLEIRTSGHLLAATTSRRCGVLWHACHKGRGTMD